MSKRIVFETDYLRFILASNGKSVEFTIKSTGKNILAADDIWFSKITRIAQDQKLCVFYPMKVTLDMPYLTVQYDGDYQAVIRVVEHRHYLTFTLDSVNREDFTSIVFMQINVDIPYAIDHSFIATCMGMTLNTRMQEYPGRNRILLGEAFTHIGWSGAKCAIIGAPEPALHSIMKEVLAEIPDGAMPKAAHSGPDALDCPDARRTYTIGGVSSLEEVDDYVDAMKQFGITQVHLHQGGLYRQGDFKVNSPNQDSDLKAIINRYHELGIQVMLHSYTFFIDEWDKKTGNQYLSPIPHKDLDVCAIFSLNQNLDGLSDVITVTESTKHVKEVFGYHEPASPILWIDDELIRFKTITKNSPYSFDQCERGVLGTKATEHQKGAEVRQLNSYFGYLAPAKNSELFYEIARNTAEFYNEFDFDGFYLDAIDGVFILDGHEFSWYHAMIFINELFKHLKKPPIFNCCYGPQYPGQWYARTRMGAFDSASRGYRDFTDAHVAFNEKFAERMYLVGELGWWSLFPPVDDHLGWQNKIMFDEDIDYICAKTLATDACQCWHGDFIDFKNIPKLASYRESIMRYTELQRTHYFAQNIKQIVRKPATEFDLVQTRDGAWHFRHTHTERLRIDSFDDGRNTFIINNQFESQKPKIRIETLYTAEDYNSINALPLLELNENELVGLNRTYEVGHLNLNRNRGICVRLYGDGQGETINIRLRSPNHIARGYADYFIKVDFSGWRSFTFYEVQNCEMPPEDWTPKQMDYKVYTDVESYYAVYRSNVDFKDIAFIDIQVNREGIFALRMKPVVATPHHEIILNNPSLIIGGQRIVFKTDLKSNTYLEYAPETGCCEVYDMLGHLLDTPEIIGQAPILANGLNTIAFDADCAAPFQKRAAVTFRTSGEILS